LETYRCQVSNGAPKEYWVWHLNKVVDGTYNNFGCNSCTDGCGVAMGTTDNAKPGEYPPYGTVWQYNQYKDPDSGEILLADFNGNWCHTGSFCLGDEVVCEIKSAKLNLRTYSTANYTIVEVDTVQTLNGNSTSGNVPTDLLSTAEADELLVDPTEIDFEYGISVNNTSVNFVVSDTETDRDGDTFPDVRVHIEQADFQKALFPMNNCEPADAKEVLFKGKFTDGRVWIGPTTVKVVCN
jgi:hypothetical protein